MLGNLKYSFWVIITAFSYFLVFLTLEYFYYYSDINFNFLNIKQALVTNKFWMTTFYIHLLSGILAMLIGPIQFIKKIRQKYVPFHRLIGRIYVFSILGFAAPTGFIMAFYAEDGIISTIGFLFMSILWFMTTFLAVSSAKKKKIKAHEKWMYRSYAVSFAAVTLRILVPIMSLPNFGLSHQFIVVITAWLSWIINLLIIEIYLKNKFKSFT